MREGSFDVLKECTLIKLSNVKINQQIDKFKRVKRAEVCLCNTKMRVGSFDALKECTLSSYQM